jgi:hypothetical protein
VNPRAVQVVSEHERKTFEQDADILALRVVVCISTTAEHTEAQSVRARHSFMEKNGK